MIGEQTNIMWVLIPIIHLNTKSILDENFKKNLVTYVSGNVLYATIPLILLPILTRLFKQKEYSEVNMFALLMGLLNAFIDVNTHDFIIRISFPLN